MKKANHQETCDDLTLFDMLFPNFNFSHILWVRTYIGIKINGDFGENF